MYEVISKQVWLDYALIKSGQTHKGERRGNRFFPKKGEIIELKNNGWVRLMSQPVWVVRNDDYKIVLGGEDV